MFINIKSDFLKNILHMFSGVLFSQLITIAGSLILTRLYLPSQFGMFSLFISIVSILSILATLRYENIIIVLRNNKLLSYIISFLINYSIIFSIIVFIIVLLLNNQEKINFKIQEFYFLIPLGIFVYSVYQIYNNVNVRFKKFKNISKSKVLMSVIALGSQILFSFFHIKLGLLYGYMLGYISSLYILYIPNYYIISLLNNKVSILLKKYSYFIKHALPADFINNLSTNIIPILITSWFDIKTAGLYFLGYRITNLPLQLLANSIGKVYFQKASELYNFEPWLLYGFTKKIVKNLSLVIIPLSILFIWGNEIISFLFGDKWEMAGKYISILVFMFFWRTLFSPISHIAEILKKVYIILVFSIYSLLTTLIALYIGHIYNDFLIGIGLLSLLLSMGYIFLLIYFLKFLKGISYEI